MKKIDRNGPDGVQIGLNQLATTAEFLDVLREEVSARGLLLTDVMRYVGVAYDQASMRSRGNDWIITLRKEGHHTMELWTVLVTFLRVQSAWPGSLPWRQEGEGRKI